MMGCEFKFDVQPNAIGFAQRVVEESVKRRWRLKPEPNAIESPLFVQSQRCSSLCWSESESPVALES
jgi:hypothetical protein